MDNCLYNMKLHEQKSVGDHLLDTVATQVTRVPGGWVYSQLDKSCNVMGTCFVPFDNEFCVGQDEDYE